MKPSLRWITWIVLGLSLTACFPLFRPAQQPNPSIPLFILAGQSNMQGQMGDAAAYPPDPLQLDPGIPFYWAIPRVNHRSEAWTHLQPQPGFFQNGHFGPEVSFARQH